MSTAWMKSAGCIDFTEVMFPTEGDIEAIGVAKGICDTCPVKRPCLEYALGRGEPDGVWGGMEEVERRKYRRKLQRVALEKSRRPADAPVQISLFIVDPLVGADVV